MENDSIYLHRVNVASQAIIIWASISATIMLILGAIDIKSGPAVSLSIIETAVFIACAVYAKKGYYYLFWIILGLFLIDTIWAFKSFTFTPLSLLIRLGIGILITIGTISSLKVSSVDSNADQFSNSNNSENKSKSESSDNFRQEKFEEIKPEKDTEEYFHSILHTDKNSSADDITKAYKDEIKKYHPDRVEHLGIEFQEIAEKKTKDINRAYYYFKNKLNF